MKKKAKLRVACIQLNAGADWRLNWSRLERQLQNAVDAGVDWIVLPENFIARVSEKEMSAWPRDLVSQTLSRLEFFSKKFKTAVIAGSLPEILRGSSRAAVKWANTCFVFSKEGKVILRYRKMHLFDVHLPQVQVEESKTVSAGNKPGEFKLEGIHAGVGICYDLRFPEYFRVLSQKGAKVLFLPSNFTSETGKTAWEVLVRARAIENQCYVVAPNQWGRHPDSGIISYGNSMIVDPLGRVIGRAGFNRSEVLIADLDFKGLGYFRTQFPVLKHRKIF